MKVLVTGSSGHIGKHVVKELIAQGFRVIVNDLCHKNLNNEAVISEANMIVSAICKLIESLVGKIYWFEKT